MTQTKNRFSFFRQTREKTEEPTLHQDELPSKADLLPDSVLPVNIQVQVFLLNLEQGDSRDC